MSTIIRESPAISYCFGSENKVTWILFVHVFVMGVGLERMGVLVVLVENGFVVKIM